jgi:hypothetical protein
MTQVKPGPAVADTAILLATQRAMPATEGGLGIPLMLLPLQGRCFLQRAVELLVRAGCSRIHVAIGENAEAVRDLLQSGERWGVRLDYHYLGTDEPLERFSYRLGLDYRRMRCRRQGPLMFLQRPASPCAGTTCQAGAGPAGAISPAPG